VCKNIIFILIDNLRARNLGCYGYKLETSPNIDLLAKEGILFKNAYTTINSTDPALTSIFSGLYPITHGITIHKDTPKKMIAELDKKRILLLPEILKRRDMVTIAIDWLGRWHRRGYDIYTGLSYKTEYSLLSKLRRKLAKKFYEVILNKGGKIPIQYLRAIGRITNIMTKLKGQENAEFITKVAISLIEKIKNNSFFLFLHYWDVHDPYYSPKFFEDFIDSKSCINTGCLIEHLKEVDDYRRTYITLWTSKFDSMEEVVAAYDSAIRYVDENIGKIINYLKYNDLYDDTLIILTADHGTSLTEFLPYFTHAGLYQPTIHVPLIFSGGKIQRKGVKYEGLVQHVDIMPTILEMLKMRAQIDYNFDGLSLLRLINCKNNKFNKKLTAFIQDVDMRGFSLILDKYKIILYNNHCEVYDLEKDPLERKNIANMNSKLTLALKEILNLKKSYFRKKAERLKINKIRKARALH